MKINYLICTIAVVVFSKNRCDDVEIVNNTGKNIKVWSVFPETFCSSKGPVYIADGKISNDDLGARGSCMLDQIKVDIPDANIRFRIADLTTRRAGDSTDKTHWKFVIKADGSVEGSLRREASAREKPLPLNNLKIEDWRV